MESVRPDFVIIISQKKSCTRFGLVFFPQIGLQQGEVSRPKASSTAVANYYFCT